MKKAIITILGIIAAASVILTGCTREKDNLMDDAESIMPSTSMKATEKTTVRPTEKTTVKQTEVSTTKAGAPESTSERSALGDAIGDAAEGAGDIADDIGNAAEKAGDRIKDAENRMNDR